MEVEWSRVEERGEWQYEGVGGGMRLVHSGGDGKERVASMEGWQRSEVERWGKG